MQATALCGRQSCLQAAFQAAVEQTTHAVRRYFSGFVFRRHPAAKTEKFVAYRKRRPERPPAGTIACRTNGQSPERAKFALLRWRPALTDAFILTSRTRRVPFLTSVSHVPGGHRGRSPRRSSGARLDKLKHVLPSGADMSVRATSEATAHWGKWPKPSRGRSPPVTDLGSATAGTFPPAGSAAAPGLLRPLPGSCR